MGEVTTVRLRNITSGAVVETAEDNAARLGSEWEPESSKAPAKKAAPSKSSK